MAKRRLVVTILTGMVLTSMIWSAWAQEGVDEAFRTFSAPDLGSFDYPLDTYTVRQGYTNSPLILFPGVISIEPNDSFLFGARSPNKGLIYQMQIGATVKAGFTADNLEEALGQLSVLQYDPSSLDGLRIQHIEVDGAPAVRVNGLAVGLSGGPVTHVIALRMPDASSLVEFVISPAVVFGAYVPGEVNQGDPNVNRRLMDDIINSFQFNE